MNTPLLQPYLTFGGRCEEALDFYATALGAQRLMLMRFGESPEPMPAGSMPEDWPNKVMHASMRLGDCIFMASDGCPSGTPGTFSGFALSLSLADETAARRAFDALSEGGNVTMPLDKTFWSPCFGMVTDRFGVSWMVSVATEA